MKKAVSDLSAESAPSRQLWDKLSAQPHPSSRRDHVAFRSSLKDDVIYPAAGSTRLYQVHPARTALIELPIRKTKRGTDCTSLLTIFYTSGTMTKGNNIGTIKKQYLLGGGL